MKKTTNKQKEKLVESMMPSQTCSRRRKGSDVSAHEAVELTLELQKMLPSNVPSALIQADPAGRNPSEVDSSQQELGEWEENIVTSKKSGVHHCSS